jgi:fructosamine-3-kinase
MKANLQESIFNSLPSHLKNVSEIQSLQKVSGGDINEAFRVETNIGTIFLKVNDVDKEDFFKKETSGLNHLNENTLFRVPKVLGYGKTDSYSFLALEWIERGTENSQEKSFGHLLAKMHHQSSDFFGWAENNYIGLLPQFNNQNRDWIEFFVTKRLEPQFKSGFDARWFDSADAKNLNKLYRELPNIIPVEKPSLIHGDLWSGNYMFDQNGASVIYDPAPSFSHREMDIGMMHLFGGFSDKVFEDYHEEYPLEINWKNRLHIHNLYPILVHVNLFQGGYIQQAKKIIKDFL